MIFGEGVMWYFYYKRKAEREQQRIEEMERKNPYLKVLREQGRLVHLDITENEVNERMLRANGDVVCESCGRTYREHPMVDDYLFYDEPYLYAICDGTLAKL